MRGGERREGLQGDEVMEDRRGNESTSGCDAVQVAPLRGDSFSSFYRDFNIASLFLFPFTIATVTCE